jgi:hypothetical protein
VERLLQAGLTRFIRRGSLHVTVAGSGGLEFGDGSGSAVAVRFKNRAALARLLLHPELRLGEAYMNGDLVLERGTIADLLSLLLSQQHCDKLPFMARPQAMLRSLPIGKKRTRPIRQTRRAASRRASSPWCANTRARSSGSTSMPPRAVYPSVDDRRLRRSFEDVETQRFQLGSCGVSFSSSGHDANAWCLGNSTYRPKVGSRVLRYKGVWEFNLARDGSGWQILEARVQ